MERIGLILLAIWLLLSGIRATVTNLGILTNPLLLGLLQLAAGIFLIIGLWPIFRW